MEFVIARNPEPDTSLPFLVRLPLRDGAVVLKVRDVWPRTAKVYCHPALGWPNDPEIERVPVRDCRRRGASVDLVLDRSRENRSPAPEPTTAGVRAWARDHGIGLPDRGRLRPEIWERYRRAHAGVGDVVGQPGLAIR